MLKDNGFGYIKVDYNANIGNDVDGDCAGAENLRQHLAAVREFFVKMKNEIPDLVIENCSAGGHRLEPSMLAVSSVSSFSDAHESVEIPYIAANLHRLMLPEHSLIWAVLRSDDNEQRLVYSLAATYLGVPCISGDVDKLNAEQRAVLKRGCDFYAKLTDVLKNGDTKIYGNRSVSYRHPTGTQTVVRKSKTQALVICHAFNDTADTFEIELGAEFKLCDGFYAYNIELCGTMLIINKMKELSAAAVLLEKA